MCLGFPQPTTVGPRPCPAGPLLTHSLLPTTTKITSPSFSLLTTCRDGSSATPHRMMDEAQVTRAKGLHTGLSTGESPHLETGEGRVHGPRPPSIGRFSSGGGSGCRQSRRQGRGLPLLKDSLGNSPVWSSPGLSLPLMTSEPLHPHSSFRAHGERAYSTVCAF